jgi:hypothetical protein
MKFSRLKLMSLAAGILAAMLALSFGYLWISLHFSYSEGERAGYVQKFSRRGWLCKTWEGDLALVNLPGQPAEIFSFTARDEIVAAKINTLVGRRVTLTYAQHKGVPSTCFGDTEYFITDIRSVD